MLTKHKGRVINIVSLSGERLTWTNQLLSAAKGAVIATTKALAQEVGKRNYYSKRCQRQVY